MDIINHLVDRFHQVRLRISIFNRVLIGNSVIIILGAVVGTLLTRHFALMGDLRLILLFSFAGILVTLFVNYWIIKSALYPLHELSKSLEQVDRDRVNIPQELKDYRDPDIHQLIVSIDAMLARLRNRTNQLQAISERAINAQEEERVRIAHGLHDDTAQDISMLIIHLEQMEKVLPSDAPALASHMDEAHQLSTQLLENLRKVIWNLRPSILDDLGLIPAIRWLAHTNLEKIGVQVEFDENTDLVRLPQHLETMLFRITQEAVSNIRRHANANKVSIKLEKGASRIGFEIRDDGCGFDVELAVEEALSRKRLGLLGIQERALLVGGTAKVESAPGLGTSLRLEIPLLDDYVNIEDNPEKISLPAYTLLP